MAIVLKTRLKELVDVIAPEMKNRIPKSDIVRNMSTYTPPVDTEDDKVPSAKLLKQVIEDLTESDDNIATVEKNDAGTEFTFKTVGGSEIVLTFPTGVSVSDDLVSPANETTALNLKGAAALKTQLDATLTYEVKEYTGDQKAQFIDNLGISSSTVVDDKIKDAIIAYAGDDGDGDIEDVDYAAYFTGKMA